MADSRENIRTPADLAGAFDRTLGADAANPVVLGPAGPVSRARVDELAVSIGGWITAPAGSVVGVAVANGAGFLAAVLAIWRRSCVALLIDVETPDERRGAILQSFGAAGVLRCAAAVPGDVSEFEFSSVAVPVPMAGAGRPHPEGAAVIKLTSGSTGAPRGILLSAAAVAADTFAIEAAMGIGAPDRVLAAVPMSFSYGFGSVAVPALLSGRQIVVPEAGVPLANMAAAAEFGATVMPTVPAFLAALLKRAPDWRLPATLRLVVSAGAPLSRDVAVRFRERFGLPVHVFYGASECGGITYDREGGAAERGTVGELVHGVSVALEAETGRVVVRSPAVAEGYLPAGSGLGGGAFQASDLAEWSGEELRLLGREGALLNIRGHKIDPYELEQVIRDLPGVADVVVTGLPADAASTEMCGALVAADIAPVSRQRVHDWCLEKLPSFKLPRQIVVVSRIPRNERGKVQMEEVRRLLVGGDELPPGFSR